MLEIKIEKAFKKDVARDKKSGLYSIEDFLSLVMMGKHTQVYKKFK